MMTTSPVWYSPFSSCALYRVLTLKYFLYIGFFFRRSTSTTTVFVILSLTTVPWSVRAFGCAVAVVMCLFRGLQRSEDTRDETAGCFDVAGPLELLVGKIETVLRH